MKAVPGSFPEKRDSEGKSKANIIQFFAYTIIGSLD